jgi:hypothetical protein
LAGGRRTFRRIAIGAVWVAVAGGGSQAAPADPPQLLIAPHIAGETYCDSVVNDARIVGEEAAARVCADRDENAGDRISSFLDGIGPAVSPSGHFALGYTLNLPLMRFYRESPSGWVLDRRQIATWVSTIHDVKRPVVVYLSANHFTDGGIALSDELARDPANLMWTRSGPLAADRYFVVSLHAWTLSNPAARITAMRRAAFSAVVQQICRLDAASRARIRGVSLLGEVHQLYGNFAAGQGFDAGFDDTDYAPWSVAGFRAFLAAKFGSIAALNLATGASFANFAAISPPSSDRPQDTAANVLQHIDAYAAGVVAVQGWAYDPSGRPAQVAIYLDGRLRGQVSAGLNRSDVPEADPGIATPNVGWRYDLDYRAEAPGVHRLEVFLASPGKRLVRLTRRDVIVVAGHQHSSAPVAPPEVDADAPDQAAPLRFYVDGPAAMTRLLYNPLATLWLDYRGAQVADYIKMFARLAEQSCLPHETIFSHQLLPELNSSWDADLMAVNASQRPNADYNQGATLYGGAAWGKAFFDWKRAQGWDSYAVAEMHPRFALGLAALEAALDAHRRAGARYIAPYFMSIVPLRERKLQSGELVRMLIDPANHQLGSAAFYRAIADTMHEH